MEKKEFGITKSGETAYLYIFKNSKGLKMIVSDFGASLIELWIPDKNGNPKDIVLGYDTLDKYEINPCYFGATIGRNANRVAKSVFFIDEKKYTLFNNEGQNNLHSGPDGFHLRMWEVEEVKDNAITFSICSPDGDQGYPGNLKMLTTYELRDTGIKISYSGKTDQKTVFNPTNHTYFNLNGHNSGDILNHQLKLNCKNFTPVLDSESIPSGKMVSVVDTPMDFTKSKRIGKDIDEKFFQLQVTSGYDHNFSINEETEKEGTEFAELVGEKSGISMTISTNLPGVQFYSGNFIESISGKNTSIYEKYAGLCLETQFFPNAINEEKFKSPILDRGEDTIYWTELKF